jgi:hypothetical protein
LSWRWVCAAVLAAEEELWLKKTTPRLTSTSAVAFELHRLAVPAARTRVRVRGSFAALSGRTTDDSFAALSGRTIDDTGAALAVAVGAVVSWRVPTGMADSVCTWQEALLTATLATPACVPSSCCRYAPSAVVLRHKSAR